MRSWEQEWSAVSGDEGFLALELLGGVVSSARTNTS